ncbi:MAG: hypothetical protein JEZ03_14615 [Bacteroidales bacterium]|nr:hypothetical protein [Bacteroidales bacterium]
MNKTIKYLTCISLLLIIGMLPVMSIAQTQDLGIWQGVMDGESGEGGLFYRLEFENDGTVNVCKQYGGHNYEEEKLWKASNDQIEIWSKSNALITDFDEATITKLNDKTFTYKKENRSFFLNKWNKTETAIHWVVILFVLMGLNELFRRYKWPTVIFFFVLPIILIPLWSSHEVSYWFKWVKLYSVVFASAWFTLIRYTKIGNKNYAKFIAAAFLAVNIAEAVTQDFSMGYLGNTLNAIAGVLSIITLSGYKGIHVDNSKQKDMVWPAMTTFWIIAYDIWNFVFVYLNFPGSAATQFLVLLSCTIPSLFIKKGTWLQARAFTLAAWFMYYFTSPLFIESHIVPLPRNESLMLAAGIISFVANAAYAYVHFKKKLTAKSVVA